MAVNFNQTQSGGVQVNEEALLQAQGCYASLERFRRERQRNKRYNYGDQWSDLIEVDGRSMIEEEYIRQQGSIPLKNNLIRRLVRNVMGVFSSQAMAPECYTSDPRLNTLSNQMTDLLTANGELNRIEALYLRTLEEFLIGGLVVHKKWFGRRQGRIDCWTDYVPPHNFFIDSNMRDFRTWDCQCIGQVHDVDFKTLCSQFAHSAQDCSTLSSIYCADQRSSHCTDDFGYSNDYSSFLTPRSPGLCRVIELWRKELIPIYRWHDQESGRIMRTKAEDFDKINKNTHTQPQWTMEEKWRYYFLAPTGHVLAQGDSPYLHGSHPYVAKAYPLIDGEIHAFVGDVIDQQRYTNRLITMYDWTVRSSAKGVLLVPEDCIPRGVNPRDFADTWSRFNGVLLYHPSARGEVPRQISSNASNTGITELLNLQLKLFEEISGVNSALEGRLANSAMSAQLYNQQTQNATMALHDLLKTFQEFRRDCACKDLTLIQQYHPGLSPQMRTQQFQIRFRDRAWERKTEETDQGF